MTATLLDPRLSALDELRWQVGNTPLHRIVHLNPKPGVEVYAKLEWQQFGGSVKARPARYCVHARRSRVSRPSRAAPAWRRRSCARRRHRKRKTAERARGGERSGGGGGAGAAASAF